MTDPAGHDTAGEDAAGTSPAAHPDRRGLALACLGALAGAGLVLLGAHYPWLHEVIRRPAPLPARRVVRTGSELAGVLSALGLLGLAGGVAIPATRRWGRAVLGVVLILAGVGVAAETISVLASHHAGAESVWPYVCVFGGLVLAAAGGAVVARGHRWAAMGQRYDAPAARTAARAGDTPSGAGDPQQEMWEALDRGEDPTSR